MINDASPPDTGAPDHPLTRVIDRLAHLLPAQGPISIFIHHNTLHAFEHLPFEEAVERAGKRLDREPFLAESRYRDKLAAGRILARDVESLLAEQLGIILRMTVDNLMALLQARTQAKQLTRSTSQTTVQALENNPLKFSPSAEEAMRILFGPPTRSYLDAQRAFAQGFSDLKSHQLKTYMAMQHAVHELLAGIDPTLMARELELQRGASSWLGTNKGKLWDEFLTRWKAHLGRDNSAPIETFMLHFSNYYDRGDKPGSK